MSRILAGTAGGLHEVGTSEPVAFAGRSVDSLSQDGKWAIVDGNEVWSRGTEWSKVARNGGRQLTCLLPFDDGALVGTGEAHLMRFQGDRLETLSSFEDAPTRDHWFTPWGGPPAVRSITRSGSDVYVNVHVGGILRGHPDSKWEPTIDISTDVHEVKVAGDLIVAACAVGLAESGDGGFAWSYDDEGLHATYARAVAVGSDFLFLSVSHGPRGGDAAIYRQPCDGDRPLERCDLPGFPDNIDTGCLDASNDLVAFGTRQGEVYTSSDHGASWAVVAEGLPPVQNVVIER